LNTVLKETNASNPLTNYYAELPRNIFATPVSQIHEEDQNTYQLGKNKLVQNKNEDKKRKLNEFIRAKAQKDPSIDAKSLSDFGSVWNNTDASNNHLLIFEKSISSNFYIS
jgi:hypothetical protein